MAEARKMVTEWYKLPIGDAKECRRKVHEILLEDWFLYTVV